MNYDTLDELRKGVAVGDAEAQYRLAMRLIYGDGVEEDNVLAAQLLEKAAEQGHVEAIYNLGVCYHYGHGVEADVKQACMLYWTSAQHGYGKGMVLMGRFSAEGTGVPRDDQAAVEWYRRAVNSGDPEAAADAYRALASMCMDGRGMARDPQLAIRYFALAENVKQSQRYAANIRKQRKPSAVYNKLVRDRIPDMIRAQGEEPVTRTLSDSEYIACLQDKLTEEVEEYRQSGEMEELADVMEVVLALAKAQGGGMEALMEAYCRKHAERGGFADKVFLVEKYSN